MGNKKVLITGATGNIGLEVIRALYTIGSSMDIIAGSTSIPKAKRVLAEYSVSEFRQVDFTNPSAFLMALEGVDVVFLLRPPHLASVPKYFAPFVKAMKEKKVTKVVFLSVQGAESQRFIPHHKIEKLILEEQLEYVFLRPGYFMQNLTTTLLQDIKYRHKIVIPSGNLKFNWVDARDVGLTAAYILNDFENFRNQAIEITGSEFVGFNEVAAILTEVTGISIGYESPNLFRFIRIKRKQGNPVSMIMVIIMLHFLPRFGRNKSRLTSAVTDITGINPGKIRPFAEREKEKFI